MLVAQRFYFSLLRSLLKTINSYQPRGPIEYSGEVEICKERPLLTGLLGRVH
ncbi:MAG: hypothetical protein V7L30_18020 [Nostoc sp.]